ncbi:MAG: hypothetical protein GY888_19710, partial [Planctomycetaceae bacterium]|nr:hypothetical protein [Planctomycetaceae bacterium]
GTCIDTSSDPNNCGGCNNSCTGSQVCSNGVCSNTPDPGTCCSGLGTPGCSNAEIESCVCFYDSACCLFGWDSYCAAAVENLDCGVCPYPPSRLRIA